jgi:bifunctional non-homologous end joining protein LigD
MQTEPHPLDYNQFEGVIPEGEYGGGTVMIWDLGVWAPVEGDRLGTVEDVDRQLARGQLKFLLLGRKLAGAWTLVRRGDRQWLLIKHRDQYVSPADVTLTQPRSVVSGRSLAEIARAAGATPRQLELAARADPAPGAAAASPARAVPEGARQPPAPRRKPARASGPAPRKAAKPSREPRQAPGEVRRSPPAARTPPRGARRLPGEARKPPGEARARRTA